VLSEAERERLEEKRLIKNQFAIFSNLYPELVEKNSVKYPIEDNLISKLPELHGATNLIPKPPMLPINIDPEEFERLLHIWEFCNNFADYLATPIFKLDDLRVALTYTGQEWSTLADELDWTEQMTLVQVREKGLNLINELHWALCKCYLDEILDQSQKDLHTGVELVLFSLDKTIEDKQQVWPEICRLVLLHRLEEESPQDDADSDVEQDLDYEEVFGPSADTMKSVLGKLAGMKPAQYITTLTFDEKICLLSCLVDGIHDLKAFVNILQSRVEDKTGYNREKMEIYQIIKTLETE
jgi:hypothetical protein